VRRRTSYPLCKDMNQLLEACRKMYVQDVMPLKWFASHSKEKPLYVRVLKAYSVNADLLTMMTILGLLTERPASSSDLSTPLPGKKEILGQFVKNSRVNVQKLSQKGIKLAELYMSKEYQQCKNRLFYLLMLRTTNQRLPDFFARVVQTPSLFDKEIERAAFKIIVQAKRPELYQLFLWTKFFGVNLAPRSDSIILDRRWTIYYLFHSQLQALRNLPLDEYSVYSEIRANIEKELYLLPSGMSVDDFFRILEEISKDYGYEIGWEPDREFFVGTGHMGNPQRARITIQGELPNIIEKKVVSLAADHSRILIGR